MYYNINYIITKYIINFFKHLYIMSYVIQIL